MVETNTEDNNGRKLWASSDGTIAFEQNGSLIESGSYSVETGEANRGAWPDEEPTTGDVTKAYAKAVQEAVARFKSGSN